MKPIKQWYVIAYDIRHPKRLKRTHYYLKKHALPLQRSVFLIHKKPSELHKILQAVRQRTHKTKDDVRLYPVTSPYSIWAAGTQANRIQGLYTQIPKKQKQPEKAGFFKTLFGHVA